MAKKQPAAKPDTPNTPPAKASAPAPDTTQKHAGAGETQAASSDKSPGPVISLRITAAREGFRRAGRAWSKQPTEIPVAELSEADVAALMAESMLAVEEVVL